MGGLRSLFIVYTYEKFCSMSAHMACNALSGYEQKAVIQFNRMNASADACYSGMRPVQMLAEARFLAYPAKLLMQVRYHLSRAWRVHPFGSRCLLSYPGSGLAVLIEI